MKGGLTGKRRSENRGTGLLGRQRGWRKKGARVFVVLTHPAQPPQRPRPVVENPVSAADGAPEFVVVCAEGWVGHQPREFEMKERA